MKWLVHCFVSSRSSQLQADNAPTQLKPDRSPRTSTTLVIRNECGHEPFVSRWGRINNRGSNMNQSIASAVFDSRSEAERAVSQLRSAGVRDSDISIVAQHDGKNTSTDGAGEETGDFVSKAALGAGAGALLGIAALAIPGVGPLVAAGAIAESAIGGAALTGTAIGAAAGGLSSLLTKHGVSDDDARYYEDRVNQGGVFVSVDSSANVDRERVSEILYGAGGHSSSRASSKVAGAFDGHDDPNRGPLDRSTNALGLNDDPNRGPLDRASNALSDHDDPNRGPLDRADNALDGRDDPNRGPFDRASNAIERNI
jgi:uncharacterized membrane protein